MTPEIYLFADVDDMLIETTRQSEVPGAVPVAHLTDGSPTGWLTPKHAALNKWLALGAIVIPTTARSKDGLARVQLPFNSYAITSFGGIILTPERQYEPRWHEHIMEQCAIYEADLMRIYEEMKRHALTNGIDVRMRISDESELPLFVTMKHNARNAPELDQMQTRLVEVLPQGWGLHRNNNFLGAMPPFLGKEHAVRWFKENIASPGALTVGAGDSVTDLPFIAECDFAIVPVGSQAWKYMNAIKNRLG